MFSLALTIGIYSYLILLMGLAGIIYKETIWGMSILFLVIIFFLKHDFSFEKIKNKLKAATVNTKTEWFFLALIFLQAIVNLAGVLGPEISFDALWYHLTLPKIYLLGHSINFIHGSLLYYSAMPKLLEMLYVFGLSLGSEIFPKLIHYSFGILSLVAIYKLSRIYLSKEYSLIAVLIFYSSLVVGWESITAYIDLGRVFFEIMAIWGFVNWVKTKNNKWLYESSVMLGLGLSAKLIAVASLPIFLILIVSYSILKKIKALEIIKNVIFFSLITLLVPMPWFIFSVINTGNPIYPYFTSALSFPLHYLINALTPNNLSSSFLGLFVYSNDSVSPTYLIFLPLVLFKFRKTDLMKKSLLAYALLGFLFCCLINSLGILVPQLKGGTRFALPYFAVFSIVCAKVIYDFNNKALRSYFVFLVVLTSLISICYRGAANAKFIPVIFKIQAKADFLSKNLNYNFGDFYDTDNFFKQYVKKGDKVLLYGFHNLYYVDFPFIDASWVKSDDSYNYVATQNTILPDRFKNWKLVYENTTTGVKLYNYYGLKWHY